MKVTREQIEQLALFDPAVYQAMQLYRLGEYTWEEALMALVEWYSKERDTLMKLLMEEKLKAPAPVMIGTIPEQIVRKGSK